MEVVAHRLGIQRTSVAHLVQYMQNAKSDLTNLYDTSLPLSPGTVQLCHSRGTRQERAQRWLRSHYWWGCRWLGPRTSSTWHGRSCRTPPLADWCWSTGRWRRSHPQGIGVCRLHYQCTPASHRGCCSLSFRNGTSPQSEYEG